MSTQIKWLKALIYGATFGLILSLLPLALIPLSGLLYNSLGFIVFALPGTIVVILNLYGHLNWILVVLLYFVLNIIYFGIVGTIVSLFLKEIDKKIFLILTCIFVLFLSSPLAYFNTIGQIGQTPSASKYGKALADPKQECLKDGGQWILCSDIKDSYNNPRDYLTTADYCKDLSTNPGAYGTRQYLAYPNYGCECKSGWNWSFSWNTCVSSKIGKPISQLLVIELGIILNLALLFVISLGAGFFRKKQSV